jgi:hypothetical protein
MTAIATIEMTAKLRTSRHLIVANTRVTESAYPNRVYRALSASMSPLVSLSASS